jgi:hypothetical protein
VAAPLKIVFIAPSQSTKSYYRRDIEDIVRGQRTSQPETTDVIGDAYRFFNAESAVAFRDKFRQMYPTYGIFIEDTERNRRFERNTSTPVAEVEDRRTQLFISLVVVGSQWHGLLVTPATRPGVGRCWCVRASDVPSLSGRVIESVYGDTPQDAAEKAMRRWRSLAKPYPCPWQSQIDAEVQRAAAAEIQRKQQGPGRPRPGNEN